MNKNIRVLAGPMPGAPAAEEFQKFWNFVKSKDNTSAELLLYGDICSSSGWWGDSDDTVTPVKFANDLKDIGNVEEIVLRINSGGGSVFAAQAIKSLLFAHKASKKIIIDGICASAATIFIDLGPCSISEGGIFMIHDPSTGVWGNAKDMKDAITVLEKVKDALLMSYINKTGKDKQELFDLMEATTWYTGQEAVDAGFVDSVIKMSKVAASLDTKNKLAIFNGVTVDFNKYGNSATAIEKMKNCMKGESAMNWEQILASLDEAQRKVVEAHLEALKVEAETTAQSKISDVQNTAAETEKNLQNQIATLQEQVTDLQSKIPATAVDPLDALPEEVKNLVLAERQRAADAEAKLKEIQDKEELASFVAVAKGFDKLPVNADEFGNTLREVKNTSPKGYDSLVAVLKAANNLTATGTHFQAMGSSSQGEDLIGDPYDKLDVLAQQYAKDNKVSYANAFQKVCAIHGDLYQAYLDMQRAGNDDNSTAE